MQPTLREVETDTRRLPFFDATTKAKDPLPLVALHGRRCGNYLMDLTSCATGAQGHRAYITGRCGSAPSTSKPRGQSMHDFHTAWQSRLTRTP
jgi:hypothetical protein